MNYIGIDFGTTNSVIANFDGQARVLRRSDSDIVPSVVCVNDDGSMLFGHEAKAVLSGDNGIRSIKRILGANEKVNLRGKPLDTRELAATIFRALKKIAEENLGESVVRAVVTVPANSKGLQRNATKIAAGLAGINVLTLINEPTAAAMAYGLDGGEEKTVLVYDFGGGTFDVTILELHHGVFEELASKGIGKLGGDDIDRRLAEYIAKKFAEECDLDFAPESEEFRELELACENAKIRLSEADSANVRLAHLGLDQVLTKQKFNELICDLVEATGDPMNVALADAKLSKDRIDGVLLVGGTSKIPAVREYVEAFFGRDVIVSGVDPLTCVAQGAAIASALFQDRPGMEDYAYSIKLEHSLCADPFDMDRGHKVLDPIIARGRNIPCSNTKIYSPVADYAPEISLGIYEGDIYDNVNDPENVKVAEIAIPLNPPRPREDVALSITFQYDEDGIVNVKIFDRNTGQTLEEAVRYVEGDVDPKELVKMSKQTRERVAATKEYPDASYALKQAREKVLPALDKEDTQTLDGVCQALIEAMESGDDAEVEELTATLVSELDKYPFLL